MGMFDYIKIDSKLLPYIGNIDSNYFDNELWQTKSLDNCLIIYQITKNGLIEIGYGEENLENDYEKIFIDNFHGIIRFYTDINEIWYEFDAKFTDGKLVSVTNSIDDEHIKRNNKIIKNKK